MWSACCTFMYVTHGFTPATHSCYRNMITPACLHCTVVMQVDLCRTYMLKVLLDSSKTWTIVEKSILKLEIKLINRMFPESKKKGIRHLPPLVCLTSREVRCLLACLCHCMSVCIGCMAVAAIGSLFTEEGSCFARTWNRQHHYSWNRRTVSHWIIL